MFDTGTIASLAPYRNNGGLDGSHLECLRLIRRLGVHGGRVQDAGCDWYDNRDRRGRDQGHFPCESQLPHNAIAHDRFDRLGPYCFPSIPSTALTITDAMPTGIATFQPIFIS
jgi:hypothetical protein